DISGEIGRGKTFTRQLPLGYHTLSVEFTDADNAKRRAISKVHVKSNKAPTALILRPKTGTSYGKGDPVDFIGSATDPDGQIAEWWWTSSIDGEIGTMPEFVLRNLSLGKHDVTLLVVDNDANKYTDTFSVWITIDPKSAPLVSLTNPSDGSLLLSDAAVSIKGTIVDPDSDGKIVNYQIISKQQGVLVDETFTQATAVKQVNVDKVLEKGILKRGVHELTLQATDDQGHNVQQMIKVKIADAQSSSETALNGRIGQVIGFDSLTSQDVELQFVKTALRLGMKLKQGLDKRISISTNFYAGNSPPLVLGSVTKPAGDKRALKYLEISPTDTGLIDGSSLESGGKISLRIEYTDAELSARGLNENELELYTFDESKKQWVKIAGQVDAANNFVQASIEHFSIYALFGKEIVYGPGATPTTTGTTLASGGQTVQPGGGGGGGSGGIGGFVAVQKPGTNDCRRVAQRELNFFKQNGYVQVTSCAGGFTPPSGVTTTTLPGRGTLPPLPGRGTLPTLPGVGADDDNDGLLDSWERQFFNGLQENAEEDYDGDGFTNEEEYKLNSDPTDSNDPESKGIGLMWIGLGGGLVIVIILGLVYLRKRRRKLGEAPEKIKKEEDKFLSGIGMEGVQKDAEKIVEKNTEKKEQGKEEVEINPKIVDYVVKARKAGYDDETIKNNLLQVGWDRKMVEAALG
ncbi:MAG: hypothetical protein HY361_04820, partial [Candidatus Aenigmarchaeota archaeon]|nr:hypothetical protein [Candidatus Aenigmarchaeota archaeon]